MASIMPGMARISISSGCAPMARMVARDKASSGEAPSGTKNSASFLLNFMCFHLQKESGHCHEAAVWQVRRHPPCQASPCPVSYTHLRAHETRHDLVCRLLLE